MKYNFRIFCNQFAFLYFQILKIHEYEKTNHFKLPSRYM